VNQEDSEQNEVDGMKKGADSTGKLHRQSVGIMGVLFLVDFNYFRLFAVQTRRSSAVRGRAAATKTPPTSKKPCTVSVTSSHRLP